jgi:hypothetical protein
VRAPLNFSYTVEQHHVMVDILLRYYTKSSRTVNEGGPLYHQQQQHLSPGSFTHHIIGSTHFIAIESTEEVTILVQ